MSKHLEKGFYTTETNGGKGFIKIAFESLADLHAADDELRAVLAQEAGKCEPVAWMFRWDYDHGNGWCRNAVRFVENMEHVEHEDKSTWRDIKPLYTSPPAPVSVLMSFDFEHPISKERRSVTLTKKDVFDGMEDYFYDKLGEQICQCESVGETNVVDCNCDEYVHDFEIVDACLDKVKELNQ